MKRSSYVVYVYVFTTSHPNVPKHILVHSLHCQQRAVFESNYGKVLSLPVTISTVGFYIIRNDRRDGPPISLQAILESNPLPVIIQPITPLVLPWLGFPFSSKVNAEMDMDTSKLRWEHQEYNLGEFAEKFKDSFPKIINVTVGFLGQQELDSISSSTHILVHSLHCQQRAVFESNYGKVLSLPVTISTVGFYIIRNDRREGPPISLQAILESNPLPVIIQPISPLVLPWLSEHHRLDTLTITHTYEEQLLLGFPFSSKGFLSRHTPLVLPMYMMEVRVALAEGLEGLDQGQFEDTCATLAGQIDELGQKNLFIFQDITILNKQELIEKGHKYMEVKPIYMSLKNQADEINLYQHLDFENTEPPTLQRNAERPPPIPPKPPYLQTTRHKPPPLPPSLENNSQSYSGGSWHPPFCSLAEVPSNLQGLSVAQVCSCLQLLNLGQYCQAFEREQIDGDLLYTVEPSMMRETLGMESLHVGKFLRFREGWRPLLGSSGAEQVG